MEKNNHFADFTVYTDYDSKTRTYALPVFAKTDDDLIRQLKKLILSPEAKDHKFVTHPEDYKIFKLGTFDVRTGQLVTFPPEHLINVHEVAAQLQSVQNSGIVST